MRERVKRFRSWLFTPAGTLWYFGTAYGVMVAYWAWRLL